MRPESPDPLLAVVLDEDTAFHRRTLIQTVALARRRRHVRLMRRTLSGVAVLVFVALLVRHAPTNSLPGAPASTLSPGIVHSAPLAPGESFRSRSALFASITTVPSQLAIVASEPGGVTRIETSASAPMLVYLSDQQLLAATFTGERPVLIAPGTPEAQVIFAR